MAYKLLSMFKELKNFPGYLSNKKQMRSIDEHNEIISPSSNLYNLSNEVEYNLTISSKQDPSRFPNCSTSSIDSKNSSLSSFDSKKQEHETLKIGDSVFHQVSSNSSQLSNDYSILKSRADLDKMNDQFDLGKAEKTQVKLADFEFLKVVGKGSYGTVLLARHMKEQQVYAVKVLRKEFIIKRNETNHIMRERNVLLENFNHPFLVNLHYAFQTSSKLYFILEYINGGELYFHLQKENSFTEHRSRFYAAEITSALGYLHERKIIYRDLKPENILLDRDGHIVLTDFGLCKDNLTKDDTTKTFCGSLDYLSPEILNKEAYGWSVDWWCLGVVIYEMINGLPPFFSNSNDQSKVCWNIRNKKVEFSQNTSPITRNIIEGLLQKDQKKRLGSINDVEEIKSHPFFRSIRWNDLEQKKIKPPFVPNTRNEMDVQNISTDFTHEPIPQSMCRPSIGHSSLLENEFIGFSYTAKHLIN